MKVILIGPTYPYRGGISHYTYLLNLALQRNQIDSLVFSFSRQYPAWLYPGKSDHDQSLVQPPGKAFYTLDPLHPWTWTKTVQQIINEKPDVIAIQWWTTFWSLAYSYLCRVLVKNHYPVIYIIHNVLPHEQRRWDIWLGKMALSPATAYITQTPREQDRLLGLLPDAQITICPMPVLSMPAENKPERSEARQRLDLPPDGQVLMFFGIVRPYKGLSVLLEALGALKGRLDKLILLIAGEFWEPLANYSEQIEALGINNMVRIYDHFIPNEELGNFFSASDLLVAPYVGGTQSAVVSLALGYGLPIIISDRVEPGIPAQHRAKIPVVPAGDVTALAEAIYSFFSDPQSDTGVPYLGRSLSATHPPLSPWDDWDCVLNALQKYAQSGVPRCTTCHLR